MVFNKNKKYYSSLKENEDGNWICSNPLFVGTDKGLYPIYRVNGRQGVMNKNYHELVLKDLPKDFYKEIKQDFKKLNQNTRNVLSFKEEDWNI